MSKEPSKLRAEEDGIFDDTGVIAVCFTSTRAREIGRQEACANAKLFAASRDMLTMLKKAREFIDDCGAQAGTNDFLAEMDDVIDSVTK